MDELVVQILLILGFHIAHQAVVVNDGLEIGLPESLDFQGPH